MRPVRLLTFFLALGQAQGSARSVRVKRRVRWHRSIWSCCILCPCMNRHACATYRPHHHRHPHGVAGLGRLLSGCLGALANHAYQYGSPLFFPQDETDGILESVFIPVIPTKARFCLESPRMTPRCRCSSSLLWNLVSRSGWISL